MKNLNILKFLGKYPNPVALRTSYESQSFNSRAMNDSKRKANTTHYKNDLSSNY